MVSVSLQPPHVAKFLSSTYHDPTNFLFVPPVKFVSSSVVELSELLNVLIVEFSGQGGSKGSSGTDTSILRSGYLIGPVESD